MIADRCHTLLTTETEHESAFYDSPITRPCHQREPRCDAALYKRHNNVDVSQHFIKITVVAACRRIGRCRHDAPICADRKINDDVHKSDVHGAAGNMRARVCTADAFLGGYEMGLGREMNRCEMGGQLR